MKVKLIRDVPTQGRVNDIIEVSDAYARNFLFPRRLALPATTTVVQARERDLARDRRRADREQQFVSAFFEQIPKLTVRLTANMNEQGKLFAAVKAEDVQPVLERQLGHSLPVLRFTPNHIKSGGTHQLTVTHGTHHGQLTVIIDHA